VKPLSWILEVGPISKVSSGRKVFAEGENNEQIGEGRVMGVGGGTMAVLGEWSVDEREWEEKREIGERNRHKGCRRKLRPIARTCLWE